MGGKLGVRSDATDGYDEDYDWPLWPKDAPGYVSVWHEEGVGGWDGRTGFFFDDVRAVPGPDEAKTWASIYVWADVTYTGDVMPFSLEPDGAEPPPLDRQYLLELLAVPDGVSGAPPVGTVWVLPYELFTLMLPAWPTDNGLTGYQFAFTMTAVPEPTSLLFVAVGTLLVTARRRRP